MPNVWTHILFCEEVADSVSQRLLSSQNEAYLKLGAQGPDPFFYYNFWPWIKEEPVHDIGTTLHTENCGGFLMDLIMAAKDKNVTIKSFVAGFITHHILDRNTHPFIHYHAGYEGSKHQKLEITIDTIMMERLHHIKTWKSQVFKEIDVGPELNPEITDLLYDLIHKHYPNLIQDNKNFIYKSYKDMHLALRILYDPYGWKNVLFNSFISSYSHQPIKDDVDYLNEKHHTWFHSATKEPSTKSFIDLYNQSLIEAIEILTEVNRYWKSGNEHAKFKASRLIGNISYDTGLPIENNTVNKYSKPVI